MVCKGRKRGRPARGPGTAGGTPAFLLSAPSPLHSMSVGFALAAEDLHHPLVQLSCQADVVQVVLAYLRQTT